MIRVLHCVNKMDKGGLETFIMNIYRNIDRSKIQFDFLVHTNDKCDFNDEIIALGGKIYSVPPRSKGINQNKKALEKFFEECEEYNALHLHSSSLSYVEPLKQAKKREIPIRIVHGHSTREGGAFFHKYLHKWHQLFISSYATHHFACSDTAAQWMYLEKILKSHSFRIINNGINLDHFQFDQKKRKEIRSSLNLENKFIVGHIGRLTHAKNHEFLLEFFYSLQHKIPNSVLLLVGDGELREKIEQKIEQLNLTDKVFLTGMRDDISSLLQAMDVFVFPSLFEGLPVTLVEAQASGLDCIVSNNITKQVALTDSITFLDLSSSREEWLEEVMKIKNSEKKRDEVKISNDFDIKVISQDLESIYFSFKDANVSH